MKKRKKSKGVKASSKSMPSLSRRLETSNRSSDDMVRVNSLDNKAYEPRKKRSRGRVSVKGRRFVNWPTKGKNGPVVIKYISDMVSEPEAIKPEPVKPEPVEYGIFTVCLVCQCRLRPHRLASHLKRVHGTDNT